MEERIEEAAEAGKTRRFTLRVSPQELTLWRRAARLAGCSVSRLARNAANLRSRDLILAETLRGKPTNGSEPEPHKGS